MLDLDEEERIQESLDILDTAITQQKRIFFNDMANYSPKASIPIKERMKRFLYNNLNSDDEYLMEVKRKSLLMEKHSNYTILNDAVKMNDSRYVEALIKSGAPLDNPDRNQMTPLEIAISTNNYELCAMLLYYGCITGALRKCLESGNLPSTDEDCSERTVPPLLELARNRSRDFICMKYKIVNAGKYISVVKHYLNLPDKLKTILTFDCPLY
ncbi:uncharacterized protein LOC123315469 isoform X2 [Coccinella septempunctata]|uniref:uncharacterized protein LOC123315469 isoform X2 n=1 Tax=Coccinella septempunctata TaxID=41139 RepID=UPI001D0798A7|nr:uncharacterized protein LOC123315469 isoform X2 [Coccinella septempunctata]